MQAQNSSALLIAVRVKVEQRRRPVWNRIIDTFPLQGETFFRLLPIMIVDISAKLGHLRAAVIELFRREGRTVLPVLRGPP